MINGNNTIREAQEWLLNERLKGRRADCPCCERNVKEYKRRLNSTKVRCLLWIVQRHSETGKPTWPSQDGPVHVANKGGELAKLIHWGFIEPVYARTTNKRCSGLWLPTKAGVDFALGRTTANAAYYLFIRNTVTGVDRTQVTVQEALGTEFNYFEELKTGPEYNTEMYEQLSVGRPSDVARPVDRPRRFLPHILSKDEMERRHEARSSHLGRGHHRGRKDHAGR